MDLSGPHAAGTTIPGMVGDDRRTRPCSAGCCHFRSVRHTLLSAFHLNLTELLFSLRRCALERPLLIPLASLIAGLCTADFLGSTPPSWALAALLVVTLLASLVKAPIPFLLSLSLLFFVWGGLSLQPFLAPAAGIAGFASDLPVLIEGVVDERPEGLDTGGARLYLQVERISGDRGAAAVKGRMLLQVKEGRAQLNTGDRILFSSKIRRPRNLGIPGESDYQRRLAYRSVFATGFVKAPDDVVLLRAGDGWRHRVDLLAAALGRFISRHAPGAEGGVLKALLLGDKGDVPEELNDAYARSGVNHILSISGFHVGIIFLCIFQLLYLMARSSEFLALHLNLRKSLLVVALPVVVFYLFLSGAAPATLRSVLMIAALVAALHIKREVEPVNSVMLAACLILFAAPQTLFEVSFQLSFLAIWGLVVLAPPMAACFEGVGKRIRWLLLLLAASAAAILATLVPVAYYFHRISFIGLLANLVIVPLMGYGAVVAGFAALTLSIFAPVPAAALIKLAALLVKLSDAVILYLARAPVITFYNPERLDLLLACLLLCALTFIRPRRTAGFAALLLLLVLALRAVPAEAAGDGALHICFLSIGQGDSALVRLPDGKSMVVDGGGKAGESESRVGQRLLLPALRRLGVRRVDYLVLSHEHPDHLQGVLYLAENVEVGEFWESGIPSTLYDYQKLKWVLAARGIPVRVLTAVVAPFAAGGARVEPLWPVNSEPAVSGDANDSSLVFRLSLGKSSVLFTGDFTAQSETQLLARGVSLCSSLLKVGHHGSKYASTEPFLAAVAPKAAVISAGYANPFHLPAPSTVTRLQRRGARVYRTDLEGSVEAVCAADGALQVSAPWGHFN
jgi:competence protein ComEC